MGHHCHRAGDGPPFPDPETMPRYFPAAALLIGSGLFSLCAFTYGRGIAASPSPAAAAPLAAPFLLTAASAGAALAMGVGALADAAAPERQPRRRRLS